MVALNGCLAVIGAKLTGAGVAKSEDGFWELRHPEGMPGSHNLVVRTPGTALFSPPEQTLGSTSFFASAKKMRLFASRQKVRSAGGKSENERRELESVWSQGRMGSGMCWNS